MAQQNSRARQQRVQIIIVLILIVMLGLGAFYLMGDKQDKRKGQAKRPEGMVAVPTLIANLKLGERLSARSFRVNFMKVEDVPPDAVLNPQDFVGRFATKPLLSGNYIKTNDISQQGANLGYSGLATPGKRLIVLDGAIFPGSISTLKIGDRIDLLAIGEPAGMAAAAKGKTLANSAVSVEGGGSQPGDVNSKARQLARQKLAGGQTVSSATATLVAENAIVMKTPEKGKDSNFIVLEMEPQDAHVTMLMATAGAVMRFVFRPFNEEVRHTIPEPVHVTTRLPKPASDPDAVTIISGNIRANTIPNSKRYISAERLVDTNSDAVLTGGNAMFSDSRGNFAVSNMQNMPANNGQQSIANNLSDDDF